jgi:hypothetical protein
MASLLSTWIQMSGDTVPFIGEKNMKSLTFIEAI